VSDSLDQIFIHAKQWLLSFMSGRAPDWLVQIISSLINIVALLGVFLTLFALISVLERKILGRMQNRYGPNRVGPFGLFQPVADGIKMLIKEDIVPARADKILNALPDRYRRILQLRFLEACSIKEAAHTMQVTVANAKVLQHRALRMAARVSLEMGP